MNSVPPNREESPPYAMKKKRGGGQFATPINKSCREKTRIALQTRGGGGKPYSVCNVGEKGTSHIYESGNLGLRGGEGA